MILKWGWSGEGPALRADLPPLFPPKKLRRFAAGRLVDFKVPRRIVCLDEILKGPTGKLRRIGLAEKLGLA